MDKIATGPEAAHAIDIDATPTENVRQVAAAKDMDVEDVTIVVLERTGTSRSLPSCGRQARG